MACEYEAPGYDYDTFEVLDRVERELAGKKWRSHKAVAKDLQIGESVYVRDLTGPLAGYIRQITSVSETQYSITKAALTEI